MKRVILLGDGMADYPIAELGGKTILEIAHTPFMDRIAREGTIGRIDTIPSGCTPGSDVANLSILGYDPLLCQAGRGALEAVSMGLKLAKGDVAFRCNLVTLSEDDAERTIMDDFSAGHISSKEAGIILDDMTDSLGSSERSFHSGVGYRHLMIWKGGPQTLETTPPHDIVGRVIEDFLPRGEGSDLLRQLIERSRKLLAHHPVNEKRLSRGEKPANSLWLWGQGGVPPMTRLTDRYGVAGAIISAVDLLKGIGICAGLDPLVVPGATGYIDTNYRGKAEKALAWLENKGDFIFLHVEAPDEMGHEGNVAGKREAIEAFDHEVVGRVLAGLERMGEFRLMVLSDHATPVSIRTHVADPSPFAVLSSLNQENLMSNEAFNENEALKSGILVSPGHILMEHFMGDWRCFIESL